MIITFWRVLACLLVQQIEVLEVKSHPQQGRLHDSLIAKLSHISITPILQFYAFSSCLSQDGHWTPLASLQQLWGISRDFRMVRHCYISIYLMHNQKKKLKQTPNKWQYLTCNQSVIFKPKLAKWYSNTQIVICQWKLDNYKTRLDCFCLKSKLI